MRRSLGAEGRACREEDNEGGMGGGEDDACRGGPRQERQPQCLLKEFENLQFKDGGSIDDFAVRVNTLVGGLCELGEEVKDGCVVRKVLRVVPKKWKQVAVPIEMLLDLNKVSMEELIRRLHVVEDTDSDNTKAKEVTTEGVVQLYLTEAQWEARRREWNAERRRRGGVRRGNGGRDKRRGNSDRSNDSDDEHNDTDDDTSNTALGSSQRGWSRNKEQCFECSGYGHITHFCREKKRKEKALLADVEEPTLL